MQYEVDALDPAVLRIMFRSAISQFWDEDAYQAVVDREAAEREQLHGLLDGGES